MAWVSEKQILASDWVAGRIAHSNNDTPPAWWPSVNTLDSSLPPSNRNLSAAAPDPHKTGLPLPPSAWMQAPQDGVSLSQQPTEDSVFADDETAAVTAPGRQARSSWCLVWCDERCHKQENEESRQQLAAASRDVRGSFICRRKAAKYIAWLNYGPPPPYVLLASWREVKPCVAALNEQGNSCNPILLVILAENRRVYDKACVWATSTEQGTTTNFRIEVIQDLGCHALKTLVKGSIANSLASAGILKVGARLTPYSSQLLQAPKAAHSTPVPLPAFSVPQLRSPPLQVPGSPVAQQPLEPQPQCRTYRQLHHGHQQYDRCEVPLGLPGAAFQHQHQHQHQQKQHQYQLLQQKHHLHQHEIEELQRHLRMHAQDSKREQQHQQQPTVYCSSGTWSSTDVSDNSSEEESGSPFQLHILTMDLERILVDALK